ncbi:MAG: M28 family peptidase [Planctomycetes bacterium]|nr:M28 family peptidase [Planctomycetota bacterium]
MRHLPLSAFVLLLSVALLGQAPEPVAPESEASPQPAPPAAMQTIGQKDLLAWASWLADDARGGRMTGSPGQLAAADYIAAHFAGLGLEPLGDEVDGQRGFVQHYPITRLHVLPQTKLQLGALALDDGFAVLGARPMDLALEGTLRFCGLGRLRGTQADIPDGESLEGTVAVVVVRSPRGRLRGPLSVEQKMMMAFQPLGQIGRIARTLEKAGASAALFVMLEDPIGLSDALNYTALSPGKDMVKARFDGGDSSLAMMSGMLAGAKEMPSLVLSVAASARLLGELGLEPKAVAAFVGDDGERPTAKDDVPARLVLAIAQDDEAMASNVVAVLRGSDPQLAAEALVYSAHMDHVGRRMDGEVYNGADDNASGSAGLMGIAQAFVKSEQKPRRSVIFLSVSGEEMGLWGSAFFADHPTWPADKIIADINTDMIGRSGPETAKGEVTVTPSFRHNMYSTIVRDAAGFAQQLGLTFTVGDKYYERSDHYNFAKKGIPVVFFCNGEHEDYHQVTDHADKLEGEKMERIARLAFWTGWAVANADEVPRRLGRREDWR